MGAFEVLLVLVAIPMFIGIMALLIAFFQWLWNITMPDVFGVNEVTFWQAFRLIIIASILFGGPAAAGGG